jgi:hypothetical protein
VWRRRQAARQRHEARGKVDATHRDGLAHRADDDAARTFAGVCHVNCLCISPDQLDGREGRHHVVFAQEGVAGNIEIDDEC